MQDDEFSRKFNPPPTDLNGPAIVQFLPFTSPVIGVPMSSIMASSAEGMSTPTSAVLAGGVPPPPVGNPIPSAPTAPLSPSNRVVQPPTSSNVVGPSSGVVTGIPSAPFASPSFTHTS